jgi:hypothetical protein
MNELEHIQSEQGGLHSGGSRPRGPSWRNLHHSRFFWLSLVFLLLGMVIFVMTDSFALRPGARGQVQPSAANPVPRP